MALKVTTKYLDGFVEKNEFCGIAPQVELAGKLIEQKSGLGNDFLGWVDLPENYDKQEFEAIKKAAKKIREDSDILVVIGIGGSYLGARAVIELLGTQFYNELNPLKVYFAGNNISSDYLTNLLKICEGKRVSVNVVSKSGTTTEPAIAFRVFKEFLEKQYGDKASERIYATTDKARGTLKALSDQNKYQTFVIPDDVGGRFSVLTAVGLLPIAAAGFDIDKLMEGAAAACEKYKGGDVQTNEVLKYAAARNILYNKGKTTELMACYEPSFTMMNEWYKQLYGESEGKDQKGIFPASVIFSTDLHSMGQYVQDGRRDLFETVVKFNKSASCVTIKQENEDFDGLNYLAGKELSFVNDKAFEGTLLAHTEGGVPNIIIELDEIDEKNVGELIYFYEKACGVSGYLLGVNPFDQPGVEAYKKNMFALLGKKGFEQQREQLLKMLGN